MIVSHKKDIKAVKVENPQAKNASMKVLVSPTEGWEGYVMRIFQIEVGGYTPKHNHPWPHINYIVSGKGRLHFGGKDIDVEVGSFAYVPSNSEHQFSNIGNEVFEFICIVPEEGHK